MKLFFAVMLGGWQVLVLLLLFLLILLLYVIARKRVVTVPSMTLVLEKNTYDHGETVNVSGVVNLDVDKPAEGETVTFGLKDSVGKTFAVGTATTGADGKYSASFPVPGDVAPGGVDITASVEALGVTATQTFTLAQHP